MSGLIYVFNSRGLSGFYDDIKAANKLASCFRHEGSQLLFVCLSPPASLNEFNFRVRGKVGVKRVRLNSDDAIDASTMASRCRESCKVLSHRRFAMVLRKMQADAEVAMQIQIALRCISHSHTRTRLRTRTRTRKHSKSICNSLHNTEFFTLC